MWHPHVEFILSHEIINITNHSPALVAAWHNIDDDE